MTNHEMIAIGVNKYRDQEFTSQEIKRIGTALTRLK